MTESEPKPIYCSRCGREAPLMPGHEEPATNINDDGELVPDYGIFTGPVRDVLDWADAPEGGLICPGCTTEEEFRSTNGYCVRCGRDLDEEEEEPLGEVCQGCLTHEERRQATLRYLRLLDGALAKGKSVDLDFAVDIMLQRAVPNKWHYLDPVDLNEGPWDTVSEDLQQTLIRCSLLRTEARVSAIHDLDGTVHELTDADRQRREEEYAKLAAEAIGAYIAETGTRGTEVR